MLVAEMRGARCASVLVLAIVCGAASAAAIGIRGGAAADSDGFRLDEYGNVVPLGEEVRGC